MFDSTVSAAIMGLPTFVIDLFYVIAKKKTELGAFLVRSVFFASKSIPKSLIIDSLSTIKQP